jgi:hypothetical protein
MKVATTLVLLLSTLGAASAQKATLPAKTPFVVAVDTLRATMLQLSSSHTITAEDGTVLPYNVSVIDVSANPSTCTVTWKNRVDLGSGSRIDTVVVNVRGIQKVNSVSSTHSKMKADPAIQIVQIHMNPETPLTRTTERFNAEGKPMGTPDMNQGPVATIFANSESEGAAVIKEFTDVMTTCGQ